MYKLTLKEIYNHPVAAALFIQLAWKGELIKIRREKTWLLTDRKTFYDHVPHPLFIVRKIDLIRDLDAKNVTTLSEYCRAIYDCHRMHQEARAQESPKPDKIPFSSILKKFTLAKQE
jgi:hypothetical protein